MIWTKYFKIFMLTLLGWATVIGVILGISFLFMSFPVATYSTALGMFLLVIIAFMAYHIYKELEEDDG